MMDTETGVTHWQAGLSKLYKQCHLQTLGKQRFCLETQKEQCSYDNLTFSSNLYNRRGYVSVVLSYPICHSPKTLIQLGHMQGSKGTQYNRGSEETHTEFLHLRGLLHLLTDTMTMSYARSLPGSLHTNSIIYMYLTMKGTTCLPEDSGTMSQRG